ncbi:glycosyltransferase family 2 protein [uncultured Corynebacterium sp.]|uniref:glycosyltransferase family 2 protein n=1 Tax=uncultured Corynebacterium sp. TaxID=159447 RepID=UPI0025943FD7|nr:galactosyltransferase-related protein [uncultured Corynebacterium sp.]
MIVVSIATADRAERIAEQHRHLMQCGEEVRHGVVTMGTQSFHVPGVDVIAHVEETPVNLARARNLAGDWAASQDARGAVVFLDADCLPGKSLLKNYRAALLDNRDSVVTGPVTYLPEGADLRPEALPAQRQPHAARPDPAPGEILRSTAEQYDVFWSLSFAITAEKWRDVRETFGGFDEAFTGYGGEDTDFAWQLREHDIPLLWVGGADAFHMWHPVSSPPWEHLRDIVTNANLFHGKWGKWPMGGWLDAFERAGAIRLRAEKWEVVE